MNEGYETVTSAQLKAKAVRCLNELDICVPYIRDFESNDRVYLFKNYEGSSISPDSLVAKKLREVEKRFKCKVYAVTYETFSFGRVYSFLIVSKYREDWNVMFRLTGDPYKYIAYAYCWNLDREECSEPCSVILESAIGGIRRIG